MPSGKFELNRLGNRKSIDVFMNFYQTPAGTFQQDEWREKAMAAIEADGKTDLLEKIKQYCRENHAWLKKEKDLEEHAIDCLCSGAYRHWADFKE